MESNLFRCLKWEPDKVVITQAFPTMADPDVTKDYFLSERQRLKAIFVRNLSRRIISDCCSTSWQPTAK